MPFLDLYLLSTKSASKDRLTSKFGLHVWKSVSVYGCALQVIVNCTLGLDTALFQIMLSLVLLCLESNPAQHPESEEPLHVLSVESSICVVNFPTLHKNQPLITHYYSRISCYRKKAGMVCNSIRAMPCWWVMQVTLQSSRRTEQLIPVNFPE